MFHFRSNIPLSATTNTISESSGLTLLSYTPPHPEKGTPYHRYTYVLLKQSKALSDQVALSNEEATDFSARKFVDEHALTAVGVAFFRQIWNESVSGIFKNILSELKHVQLTVYAHFWRITDPIAYLSIYSYFALFTRRHIPFPQSNPRLCTADLPSPRRIECRHQ